MGQINQEFQFQTESAPQIEGTDGASWENLPLASFPPSFDLSVPDSFSNALSGALNNTANSFSGLSNTLTTLTQNLQNAACSFDSLITSLENAQSMAQTFADTNNNTTLYVRAVGVQPPGSITSLNSFINSVRDAVTDTGEEVGKLPKVVPVKVPLDVNAISSALTADQDSAIDQLIEGSQIGNVNIGIGLEPLSNNEQLKSGFVLNEFSSSIVAILKSDDEVEYRIQDTPPINPNELIGRTLITSNTLQSNNTGTFTITGFNDSGTFFGLKVINSNGLAEAPSRGDVQLSLDGQIVGTTTKIRSSFERRGLLEPNQQRFIDVVSLVDILIEEQIIGVNPDLFDQDRSIAIERLSRLVSSVNTRVGGMVLVGQSPNLPTLAAKVTTLSDQLEFLKPLAEQLALSAAEQSRTQTNISGIGFNPDEIELVKLDSSKNIGVKDAQAAQKRAQDSGVLNFEMPTLNSLASEEQPPPSQFNAWRHYHPSDLFPSLLDAFGLSSAASGVQQVQQAQQGLISSGRRAFGQAFGGLAQVIEEGQAAASEAFTNLGSQANAVDGIVNQMNQLNEEMVEGINFLKNQIQKNPFKMDAHLIGPQLNLLSNAEYADAVEQALRDTTDPNRPTFGPPASSSVLDSQETLNAALQGNASPIRNTRLWFGVLIFIVGNGREDLGEQMRSIAELLSMDASPIDIEDKDRFSLSFRR